MKKGTKALEIQIIKGKKKAKIPKQKKTRSATRLWINEIFTPGCIGHLSRHMPIPPTGDVFQIQDFLVDSSGISKGGESVNPLIQLGLNAAKKINLTIRPEACKDIFKVKLPAGIQKGTFGIAFGRISVDPIINNPGFYDIYPVSVNFVGLTGQAPFISDALLAITDGTNNEYKILVDGEFTQNFSFREIKVQCAYPQRNFLPEFSFYKLSSPGHPHTIPNAVDVCSVLFGYVSPSGTDLGPIIKLH